MRQLICVMGVIGAIFTFRPQIANLLSLPAVGVVSLLFPVPRTPFRVNFRFPTDIPQCENDKTVLHRLLLRKTRL